MIVRTLIMLLLQASLVSCASFKPPPPVRVITKPVRIDIYQPPSPRPVHLSDVEWFVITDSPCVPATGETTVFGSDNTYYTTDKYEKDGNDFIELLPIVDEFGNVIQVCGNIQQKIAEIETQLDGEFVIFALSPKDYENFAINLQELQRYVNQLQELEAYYRVVTSPEDWLEENKIRQREQIEAILQRNESEMNKEFPRSGVDLRNLLINLKNGLL